METLSAPETQKLYKLEAIIRKTEAHALNFIEAFREIRDKKLYRAEFGTFAEYCRSKWKKSVRTVQQALQIEGIKEEMRAGRASLNTSESEQFTDEPSGKEVRELIKVPKGRRVEVMRKAVEKHGPNPGPKAVREVISEVIHKRVVDTPRRDYSDVYTNGPATRGAAGAVAAVDATMVEAFRHRLLKAFDTLKEIELHTWDDAEQVCIDVRKLIVECK